MEQVITAVSGILTDYILVVVLLVAAVYFTIRTGGVQFRMAGEMIRLLLHSGKRDEDSHGVPAKDTVSSFQAREFGSYSEK